MMRRSVFGNSNLPAYTGRGWERRGKYSDLRSAGNRSASGYTVMITSILRWP